MLARVLSSIVVLAALACVPAPERAEDNGRSEQEPAPGPAPAPAPAPAPTHAPTTEPDYASFGMPSVGTPWSNADYTEARKAVTAIAKADPKLLPRDGSATFGQLADVEHLRALAGGIAPEQLAGLSLSLGTIHMIYGDQIGKQPELEREQLMLSAAVVAVTSKLPLTTVRDEAEATALRAEPTRLKGILRFRHGVYEMLVDMLEPAPNSVLPCSVAGEQLARVIEDAAPLLLEDERASLREQVRACEGLEPEAVARVERALASDAPTAALVSALLAEHREFKTTQ